jgi:hypothetical protein
MKATPPSRLFLTSPTPLLKKSPNRFNLNNSHTELYTGEFRVLHRSPSIVRIAQSRLQWAELVDCRRETRNMLCTEF